MEPESSHHVRVNRRNWEARAAQYVDAAERNWRSDEPRWGIWGVPDDELHLLPNDLEGKDVVELGCGTAYVSAWLARREARPVGVDVAWDQLATANRLRADHRLHVHLVQGDAERVPLTDASFDLAISEYGASIWCDPYQWIPEASRLLRPGGELIFLLNGMFLLLTAPDSEDEPPTDRLIHDYFGMRRFDSSGSDPSVSFGLGYGDWIRLLRGSGFEVEDMIEVRPPEGSTSPFPWITLEWSRRWPCEEVWKARRR
jgi:SAM-dependent methyltransferase